MVMEIIARRTAVEYFLLLGRRGSGVCPPPPPSSPPPSSSPSREGGFPPPLPRMSSMISSMSSTTVPGMALTSVRDAPKSRVYTKLPHMEPCDENTKRKVERIGAVERIRTFTVLLPPAPQAGASASSATTANCFKAYSLRERLRKRRFLIILRRHRQCNKNRRDSARLAKAKLTVS